MRLMTFGALAGAVLVIACGDDGGTADNGNGVGGGSAASGKGGTGGLNLGGGANGGGTAGGGNGTGTGGNGYCGSTLTGTVRDFRIDHPDFEYNIEDDPGIVLPDLGSDNLPVYAGDAGNPTTTG